MASFGKYELVASLGRGGSADVFLALSRGPVGFEKLLVIKRLRADLAQDAGYRRMLSDEARLAARLRHPNVVQTFEVGDDGGHQFIAMEYLEGQPLNKVFSASRRSGRSMEVEVWIRIVCDALAGLHYAHELTDFDGRGLYIVHRDVSPHNLFVTYEGEVKVVDFGIAKVAFGESLTEVGVLKGKIGYMAPEQAQGGPIDRRADVFAAGVVLWEALSGERLLRGDSAIATLRKLLQDPLPKLEEVCPGIDRGLSRICDRALQKDPAIRYASALEMKLDLERWLDISGRRAARREDVAARMQWLFAKEREQVQQRVQAFVQSVRLESSGQYVDGASHLPSLIPGDRSSQTGTSHSPLTSMPSSANATGTHARLSGPHSGMSGGILPPPSPPRSQWPTLVAVALVAGLGGTGAFMLLGRTRLSPPVAATTSETHGTAGARTPVEVALKLCGSNTMGAELAPSLLEAFLHSKGATTTRAPGPKGNSSRIVASYAGRSTPVAYDVEAEGSATAFDGLARGSCDIGMASRSVSAEEAQRLMSLGLGDPRLPASEHVVALDGIAVIVHPNNPLRVLSVDQIAQLFSGETDQWSTLDAGDMKVSVFARDDASGTYDTFRHLVLGKRRLSPNAKRFAESDRLSDEVAGEASAIGFIGLAYVRSAKALAIGDKSTTPTLASAFTVSTEGYPLSRRLFFYTPLRPKNPLTTEFVSFALSSEGQKSVRAAGFVDLTIGMSSPSDGCLGCPPRYASMVKGAQRLNVDFRFRHGSNELDSRGTRDLDRLVLFLRAYPSARLLLLGFSDGSGDAMVNLGLSRERAKRVSDELASRGVHAAVVDGFGQEMPVAANSDEAGRTRNRRVEVWLGPSAP